MPTLQDLVDLVHGWYPPGTADSWDAVGLVHGDPAAPVRKVMFAVDPTLEVAREAAGWGADLLVVHHPLFLKPVHGFAATTPKGRTLAALSGAGCALLTAHTNADRAVGGVSEALATALGLTELRPVAADWDAPLDKLTAYVPRADADRVRAALAEAGAGRIGDYDQASFSSPGEGRFRPLAGAAPTIGEVGRPEVVEEVRVEVVLPRGRRTAVVAAMLAAHPYEEPAYDVVELADPGTAPTGAGRIGTVAETTLRQFAATVAGALPGDGARRAGRRRPGPRRTTGRGVRGSRRLPARGGAAQRRRRLRHQRPAPPPGRGVPREGRARPGGRGALGGGVDLAAGGAGAGGRRAGRYGGDPGQHEVHGPLELPPVRASPPHTTGRDRPRPRRSR